MTYDLVIAGSGAAGMTAAITAARAGLKVLMVEKAACNGGTTALSGGGLWIPNNDHQRAAGLPDSKDQAQTYLKNILGRYYDQGKVDAFLATAPEMLRFIEANSDLRTVTTRGIDYEPWLEGAALGRSVITPAYDNKRLGRDREHLRPPLRALTAFGGMQIAIEDVPHFVNVLGSFRSFVYSVGKLTRHLCDRIVHGRSTRSVNGNALAAELLKGMIDSGVTVWNRAPLRSLVRTGARVTGVVVEHEGQRKQISVGRGVILATGGYGANQQMRLKHVPRADMGCSLQPAENEGDGILLGIEAGGRLVEDNRANGIWIPVSKMWGADGREVIYPHMYERHKPGFILVDVHGRRFCNDGASYQALGNSMHEKNVDRAFLIGDHFAVRRHGFGLAKPSPLPLAPYVGDHYIQRSPSLAGLAQKLGVDGDALQKTVDAYNIHAERGADPEFHRGEDAYSVALGDPAHRSNPAVGPLHTPPFYGIEIRCGELSSINGLETDACARVIGPNGQPIEGLYAAGVDSNSLFRGAYPGAGASLGPGMTFGYIAARHAAIAQ
jgi:succinate dehydrogenase/fumarate reductase flavoprotein subunit